MLKFFRDLKSLWYLDIVRRNKKTPMLVFISFLITFLIARIFATYFAKLSLIINIYHIHHFYYGFALLALSNWILLVTDKDSLKKLSAVFMGIGAGLIIDELGLLLNCTSNGLICDYNSRISFDVFTVIIGLLLLFLYSGPVYRFLKRRIIQR